MSRTPNRDTENHLMTTQIWIEPVKRRDGSDWYTDRGLLLRTRLGAPAGEIICDGVHNAVCESCRVLMSRGITGHFETWKEGVPYGCLRGDIEITAGVKVEEGSTKSPRFKRWEPHPHLQIALCCARGDAPASEEDAAGRVVATDMIACSGKKVSTLLCPTVARLMPQDWRPNDPFSL